MLNLCLCKLNIIPDEMCSRVVFLRLVLFQPVYTSPEIPRADGPESSHVIVQRGFVHCTTLSPEQEKEVAI